MWRSSGAAVVGADRLNVFCYWLDPSAIALVIPDVIRVHGFSRDDKFFESTVSSGDAFRMVVSIFGSESTSTIVRYHRVRRYNKLHWRFTQSTLEVQVKLERTDLPEGAEAPNGFRGRWTNITLEVCSSLLAPDYPLTADQILIAFKHHIERIGFLVAERNGDSELGPDTFSRRIKQTIMLANLPIELIGLQRLAASRPTYRVQLRRDDIVREFEMWAGVTDENLEHLLKRHKNALQRLARRALTPSPSAPC